MNMQNPDEKIVVKIDPDLEDIIPGFLQKRRKDIEEIQRALAGNDFEAIRVLGHTMKGIGGGYGFDAITSIGSAIEQSAKNNNTDEIKYSLDELASYMDHVEVVYE